MPLHDWTRVEPGVFHGFHTRWIVHLQEHLNAVVLPRGYYADSEQVARPFVADLLTLREPPSLFDPSENSSGSVSVVDAPPRTQRHLTMRHAVTSVPRSRRLAIRHVSGDRIVALIEIVSPSNKDRSESVADFAQKVTDALNVGIHVLVLDLFPAGLHDPFGMHGAIAELHGEPPVELPTGKPITFASYAATRQVDVFLEYRAFGEELPTMPMYLSAERYVNVPLTGSILPASLGRHSTTMA